MRLFLKFSAVALVAVCCQLFIQAGWETFDEAQFTARVYIAHLRGEPMDDPELIDLGEQFIMRQLARGLPGYKPYEAPTTRPVVCAADEFDW